MPMIRVTMIDEDSEPKHVPIILEASRYRFEPACDPSREKTGAQSFALELGEDGDVLHLLLEPIDEIWKRIEAVQSRPVVAVLQPGMTGPASPGLPIFHK